jgi:plastocyanin
MKRSALLTVFAFALCASLLPSVLAAPKKQVHSVSIDDMKFQPADLSVAVGDSVEWTNNDDRDHNVAAKDGSFKSPNLSNGATFKYTFKKAGKFAYGCSLHPRMKGTVTVASDDGK